MPESYFLQFGRTPALSLVELRAMLPGVELTLVGQGVRFQLDSDAQALEVFHQLGGGMKLLRYVTTMEKPTVPEVSAWLVEYFAQDTNVTLAVAEWGRDHLPKIDPAELKREIVKRGQKVRYVESPRAGLTAAVLLHQKVHEVVVYQVGTQVHLLTTLGVQDIDSWTIRDREKPYANRKAGMLPPKVARMMVNIALGSTATGKRLYDPFCGSGTILLEAAMRGATVVGSDLDSQAAAGAQENLTWLPTAQPLAGEVAGKVFAADATNVTLAQVGGTVDAIVTEPFLGKQTPQAAQLPNIFKGLNKLYLGAFKNWAKLLKPGAMVVVIFPMANGSADLPLKQPFSLKEIIDKLPSLGYTSLSEPVGYARPGAIIERQIQILRFEGQQPK